MARQLRSQHDQRVYNEGTRQSGEFFLDQHGRTWHAEVEVATGHPCSPYRIADDRLAVPGFLPLDPPQPYMKFVRGQLVNGRRLPYDILIDYDQWLADWRSAHAEWDRRARKLAIEKYGAQWDGKEYPEDILLLMGNGPKALGPVQAARQGHKYVLGLAHPDPTKARDMQLKQILEPIMRSEDPDWMGDEPNYLADDTVADVEAPEMVASPKRRGRPPKAATPIEHPA